MNLDVNKEVFDIWKEFSGDENKVYKENFDKLVSKNNNEKLKNKDPLNNLCPITYKEDEYTKPEDDEYNYRFLFSGFNPSLNEKHYREKCEEINGKNIEPYEFFKYSKDETWDEDIVKVDYSLRHKKTSSFPDNYYSTYFDRLKEFIEEDIFKDRDDRNKLHHVHIDPFFIRGTNQNQAREILMLNKKNNWKAMEDGFADKQLKLFEKMIKSYDPTHIIILNATASHILSKRWKDENDIKTSFEFHRAKVICGGMLFGAGGMDTYSKERFAKEIRKNLKR